MKKRIQLAVQVAGPARKETLMGREFRVVPALIVQEQVLHNNLGRTYLPAAAITAEWTDTMNGSPVVVDHPSSRGLPISARRPDVLNEIGVGFLFNARVDGTAVKADVYLDEARSEDVPDLAVILEKIENGETPELSTGFPVQVMHQQGEFDGRPYDLVMIPAGFDHLAVFAEKIGACSVSDGCGLGVNHEGPCQTSRISDDPQEGGAAAGSPAAAANTDQQQDTSDADVGEPPPVEKVARLSAWQRFAAMVRSLFTRNESDEDRRRLLGSAVSETFGGEGRYTWIDSVHSDEGYLVYEVQTEGEDGSGLFRVDYEIGEDGKVTLGEPQQVRRITTYEPVANTGESSQEEDAMNRQQMIAQLARAGVLDEAALNKLSDCQLRALLSAGNEGAGGQAANGGSEPLPQPQGEHDPWTFAHRYRREVEELRERTANALRLEESERLRLLDDVLYAKNSPWSDEEVRRMSLAELRKVHAALFPRQDDSFIGRGGPRTVNAGGSFSANFVTGILDAPAGRSVLDQETH